MEEKEAKKFKNKPTQIINAESSTNFGGTLITHQGEKIIMGQPLHVDKINLLDTSNFTKAANISETAKGAYIATMCRPDVLFQLLKAAKVQELNTKDATYLNNALKQLKEKEDGNKFKKLDKPSTKLMVFDDASFASNCDKTSQIGYILTLTDKDRK